MKFSRKASIPAAVAVTLGLVATGVSCTGSKADKVDSTGKTTGPTLAKGDKTVAKPGTPAPATTTAPAAAGKTPAAPPAQRTPTPGAPPPTAPSSSTFPGAEPTGPPPRPRPRSA